MIPSYPKFKKLEIEDKNEVVKITSQFQPSSDFNFLGLWSYNVKDDVQVSKLNENLIIRSRDYLVHTPFFSFLGSNKFRETARELVDYALRMNIDPHLRLIPEDNLVYESIELQDIVIEADRDNFDYVYSTRELTTLVGSKYAKKRNLLSKFQKTYAHTIVLKLDIAQKSSQERILKIFARWMINKMNKTSDMENELIALRRLFDVASSFNIFALALEYEHEIIAFSVLELVFNGYAMCHFSKADIRFDGVYEKLYHEIGVMLNFFGYPYLNREQDLGVPGLRMAKSDWNPVRMIKKYTISPKP